MAQHHRDDSGACPERFFGDVVPRIAALVERVTGDPQFAARFPRSLYLVDRLVETVCEAVEAVDEILAGYREGVENDTVDRQLEGEVACILEELKAGDPIQTDGLEEPAEGE